MTKAKADKQQAAVYDQLKRFFSEVLKEKGVDYDFSNPGFSFRREKDDYVLRITHSLANALSNTLGIEVRRTVSAREMWKVFHLKYDKVTTALVGQHSERLSTSQTLVAPEPQN
jgi:hypothetical protein